MAEDEGGAAPRAGLTEAGCARSRVGAEGRRPQTLHTRSRLFPSTNSMRLTHTRHTVHLDSRDAAAEALVEVTRSKAHRPHGDPPQINLWPLRGSEAAGKRLNKVVGAEGVGPYRRVK